MSRALSCASCGPWASLTPARLAAPAGVHLGLDHDREADALGVGSRSSGVRRDVPGEIGMPKRAKTSLAWNSWMFIGRLCPIGALGRAGGRAALVASHPLRVETSPARYDRVDFGRDGAWRAWRRDGCGRPGAGLRVEAESRVGCGGCQGGGARRHSASAPRFARRSAPLSDRALELAPGSPAPCAPARALPGSTRTSPGVGCRASSCPLLHAISANCGSMVIPRSPRRRPPRRLGPMTE